MPEKINLFICEHFREETISLLSSTDFIDVNPVYLPSRCARPQLKENNLSSVINLTTTGSSDSILCGCACLSAEDKSFLKREKIRNLDMENCFQMFLGKEVINSMISKGYYLVTPGWLKTWRQAVNDWGGEAQARQMFSDSLKKIVLIDTGIDNSSDKNLKEFAEALNLPSGTVIAGLDFYRLFLSNIILQWKLEKKIRHSSDYGMAMDLLANLSRCGSEEAVAANIIEIFRMLFAPGIIHYLTVKDGIPGSIFSEGSTENIESIKLRLSKCKDEICTINSGRGFQMNIGKDGNSVAVIEADEIANPGYLSHYQNLCVSLSGVLVLAVQNARYYQRILKMNSSLEDLNHTKDKFFSIIAHDLKNPFFNILGFSELLMLNVGIYSHDKTKEYLKIINDSSNQAYELLENLLLWSRSQTGNIDFKPEKLNLKDIIVDTINLVRPQASAKGIIIESEISNDVYLSADRNMISTIMRNLLSNAIKFTPRNGRVSIDVKLLTIGVEIAVSDTGVGIPEKDIDRIFKVEEKISTAGTEKEKGTGLGLVLCREFIEKHGGKIWAESEVGKGSSFIFTLSQ